jgi:hypothetical protein
MLSRNGYISFAILFLLHLQICSYAQPTESDTAFIAASRKKIVSLYATSIQQQSRLYNGTDYVLYSSRDEEHPYFRKKATNTLENQIRKFQKPKRVKSKL